MRSFCRAASGVMGTAAADAGSVPNTASTAGTQKDSQCSSERQWCLRGPRRRLSARAAAARTCTLFLEGQHAADAGGTSAKRPALPLAREAGAQRRVRHDTENRRGP